MVSRMPRPLFSTGISACAAAPIALAGAGLRCAMPAASTRAIGCGEFFPNLQSLFVVAALHQIEDFIDQGF